MKIQTTDFGRAVTVAAVTVMSLLLIAACDSSNKKEQSDSCRVPGGENREELRRPHFVTLNLAGGQNGSSIVYRFNSATQEAKQVAVRASGSQDTLVFRDTKHDDVLMVERLNPRSRLTRLSCFEKKWPEEFGRLPSNVFGLGYLDPDSMVALGWNDGSVTSFSRDFTTVIKEDERPRSTGTLAITDGDLKFNNFLVSSSGAPFVLTSGQFSGSGSAPSPAKLLKLDSSLTQVESEWTVPGCYNAYQQYTLQLSPSELVLGCNPLWNGPNGYPVLLVRVTIDESGMPRFVRLEANTQGDAHLLIPGGSSIDGKFVFVTELSDLDQNSRGFPPGRYLRSYWLDIDTGARREMRNLAGSVVFDPVEKNYIWSCVNDPAIGSCQSKQFGLATEAAWDQPQNVKVFDINFEHTFFEFERELF